eukprot:scaffold7356_cov249-Pinguiococcus_pyrenoidosus.AAC.13
MTADALPSLLRKERPHGRSASEALAFFKRKDVSLLDCSLFLSFGCVLLRFYWKWTPSCILYAAPHAAATTRMACSQTLGQ